MYLCLCERCGNMFNGSVWIVYAIELLDCSAVGFDEWEHLPDKPDHATRDLAW